MIRTYSEMLVHETFISRFHYLKLEGQAGMSNLGDARILKQRFYGSYEWKQVRDFVRVRDYGCDLGVPGHEVFGELLVHHINPIHSRDLVDFNPAVIDPENLICVSRQTHYAIHYGNEAQLPQPFIERRPGDTDLW